VGNVVVPIARSFRPQLLLVSAGFDAHRDDPLANCLLTEETYGSMAAAMRALSVELDAALAFVLEGGYDLRALAGSVVAVIGAVQGEGAALDVAEDSLTANAREHYARWWPELAS
jgi:acetoin utilization deacetylase AcuC-like enzyme